MVLACSLSYPAACPTLLPVLPFNTSYHLSYPTSLFVCQHLLILSQYSSTTSSSWPFTKSSPPPQHFLLVSYLLIILPGKSSITQAVHCFMVVVKSISPFRYSLRNECSPSRTQTGCCQEEVEHLLSYFLPTSLWWHWWQPAAAIHHSQATSWSWITEPSSLPILAPAVNGAIRSDFSKNLKIKLCLIT